MKLSEEMNYSIYWRIQEEPKKMLARIIQSVDSISLADIYELRQADGDIIDIALRSIALFLD